MPRRFTVVMAGGSGERFWPLSRPGRPKQLLRLTDPNATMLEEAVQRVRPLVGDDGVYVATSLPLREAVLESGVVPAPQIFSEPVRRNTLGALCWVVAQFIAAGHEEASVGIVTADHYIADPEKFRGCVAAALDVAEDEGGIVTLGIPPTRPETGYGYIEEGTEEVTARDGRTARRSTSFREKPSPETAEAFVSAGNFLWNGGMFFFTIQSYLDELKRAQPEAYAATLDTANSLREGDEATAIRHFERLPNISVDYAVMEQAEKVFVIRTDFHWDDVGAWDAMERTMSADEVGNVVQGDAVLIDTRGCIVVNDVPGTVIGTVGLSDIAIVVTDNAVLVCPKSESQQVRLIAQALAKRNAPA